MNRGAKRLNPTACAGSGRQELSVPLPALSQPLLPGRRLQVLVFCCPPCLHLEPNLQTTGASVGRPERVT